jgi:hypothetical protein
MISVGYCTIPEVLMALESHGKSLADLEAALLNRELRVFVQVAREHDWEICRIPLEDLQAFSESWEAWLASGRVPSPPPDPPDPAYEEAHKAWLNDMSLPIPKREYKPRSILSLYERRRLLISEQELDRWLGAAETKAGAPGRPSSMGIVMAEFERRRGNGGCESSRQAEADALAAWLAKNHPEAPTLKAKSIFNKLPADFQPFKIDYLKL